MLNKVTLIGNLGGDPDVRHMPNGNAVTTVSIATTMRWKDRDTKERKEATEWHRVVFFNRLAEVVAEYLRKGSKIHVEGRLRTQKWEKDGIERYTTEIIATDMIMLDSKSEGLGSSASSGSSGSKGGAGQASAQTPADQYDDVPF